MHIFVEGDAHPMQGREEKGGTGKGALQSFTFLQSRSFDKCIFTVISNCCFAALIYEKLEFHSQFSVTNLADLP